MVNWLIPPKIEEMNGSFSISEGSMSTKMISQDLRNGFQG